MEPYTTTWFKTVAEMYDIKSRLTKVINQSHKPRLEMLFKMRINAFFSSYSPLRNEYIPHKEVGVETTVFLGNLMVFYGGKHI